MENTEPSELSSVSGRACLNTDRELWREREGDYYADSIHVNEGGGIGINCGGTVYVKSLRQWHELADSSSPSGTDSSSATREKDLEEQGA